MSTQTDPYHDIRPYNDDEISLALDRLIKDDEFINAIIEHRFNRQAAWLKASLRPLLRVYLKTRWRKLNTVEDIQIEVKNYLDKTLNTTTDGVTFSGLEHLDKQSSYLFISNHRDIAMDPALVNYGLFHAGHRTVRIAIGDNLLTKPCATELMKLNKSFIVKRSIKAPREMMKALGVLSSYIRHSLTTGHSIWIAQKEGRAKDGNDVTDPAILKMFHVEGRKQKQSFAQYMQSLKIVPVAISYENDPCDVAKAIELYEKSEHGEYKKGEFEDIESIIEGIVGYKGRVHVAFGQEIQQEFGTPEELATEIDRQIYQLYQLYPINHQALEWQNDQMAVTKNTPLAKKLAQLDPKYHPYLVANYANAAKRAKSA